MKRIQLAQPACVTCLHIVKGKHAFEHAHIFHSSAGQTHSSQGLPHRGPDSITWCIPAAIMTQSKFLLNAHIRRSEIMTHLFHRQILCVFFQSTELPLW